MILIKFSIILILFNLMNVVHSENNNISFKGVAVEAKKGDIDSQFALGQMYDTGKGVKKNYKEAVKWSEKLQSQDQWRHNIT